MPMQLIKNLRLQCNALHTSWLNLKSTSVSQSRCMRVDMKAIIIYHTRYGNTERIAKSLEIGLKKASDIEDVLCSNVRDIVLSATDNSLKEYDIICIGAPTEGFSAPKPIKEFLAKLKKRVNLTGKYGFAYDTKVDSKLSGSAAKFIEKELKNQGLQIIAPRESAIVFALNTGAKLKEGEDKRFEQIGLQLGTELPAKRTPST
jgi:flavorubredoxin